MAKYIVKREYNTMVFEKGEKISSVTSVSKETVTGNMETVADSMERAQEYIKSLRIDGVSFGEQRYNRSDVLSSGCSFAAIHHMHGSQVISFFLSQYSERISD